MVFPPLSPLSGPGRKARFCKPSPPGQTLAAPAGLAGGLGGGGGEVRGGPPHTVTWTKRSQAA